MNILFRLFCALILGTVSIHQVFAQFPASCDTRKECVGQAVQMLVTSGRNSHFIEVQGAPVTPRQAALTFEMWVNVEKQAGTRQYLGGLWGPNTDVNDVFLLYIDEQDQLTFEVNSEATQLQQADNTIARASVAGIYGSWHHIAAVFDGASSSVSIYVDGVLGAGPVSNAAYPVTYLKPLERSDLPLLIGSYNGIADNATNKRTLKGQVDEIRIWNRALSGPEIVCNKDKSLNGNESGLKVYYRCNEPVDNVATLCDATGNRFTGQLRSGAVNKRSNRAPARTVTVVPTSIDEAIKCDSVRQWIFTITENSICGSSTQAIIRGPEKNQFSVSASNLTLDPGVPVQITVTYRGTNVGPFLDTLEIRPGNRCGQPSTFVKLNLRRITEIGISRSAVVFDTLYVGCQDKKYIDSTIRICNTSDSLGTPRTISISSILAKESVGYQVVSPTFPRTLAVGECIDVVVRAFVRDTTGDYPDTLRIVSNDRCQATPITIALSGRTQEVISIRDPGGSRRIDTVSFSNTCPTTLSSPVEYVWQNLTLTPLVIDTIIVPPDFTHYRVRFPFTLQPKTGYAPIAIRFKPRAPGRVFDSIIIRTKIQGCTIERKIYVRGRGLDNQIEWAIQGTVDYGNVIVGQQRTINIVARNRSLFDTLGVSVYVERGEAFALLGGTGRRIPPEDSTIIPVTFRPIDSVEYLDQLCLFETRCYAQSCINLRGKGVLQTFRFSPLVMETENVIACGDRLDTVHIVNMSGTDQTISGVNFQNGSGKFVVIEPPLPWSMFTIPSNDSLRVVVRYVPNDVTQDRADRAYINYKSADNKDWQVQLIGTSSTPKIFITESTAYGTVEVGDVLQRTLVVENTSALPILLDSLTVGAGFRIVSTSRPVPLTLRPRDSISVVVEFAPTAATNYTAYLKAYSDNPCKISSAGELLGRGIIIELENAISLLNFGYVRPCECSQRELELVNASLRFDMTVDSIWIDSAGVPGGRPQFFSWKSKYSPDAIVPYTIPPGQRDTIVISFCPNTPADSARTDVRALFHVQARGSQWNKELQTYLSGKRSLTFRPFPAAIQFPYGNIDVLSNPLQVKLKIPDFLQNPTQDTVQVDSITFLPNERVFFVTAPATFPRTIKPGDSLVIDVRQRPRAPRDYVAKMVVHYSKPCVGADTTVVVKGGGFAQARGLMFTFNPNRMVPDTFNMVSCDTLIVPVYSSIVVDASVVDVFMRVDYDSTQLRLFDVQSPLSANACKTATGGLTFTPAITTVPSPYGGQMVTLKNFCGIDSLNPFAYLRFVTVANNRVDSPITIDSVNFDTEDVILYKLIATGDRGRVIARKSEIEIRSAVAYDSVRILDCVDRVLTVYNIGDVTNTLGGMLDLPVNTTIINSIPALGDSVYVGDSAMVTLRYCPRSERTIDTNVIAQSIYPCVVQDTTPVTGYGYAPELYVQTAAVQQQFVLDPWQRMLGDTVQIPIMIDSSLAATYNGVTYWLQSVNVNFTVTYNPRMLKFIYANMFAHPNATSVIATPGSVSLDIVRADSIAAGSVAVLTFIVTVPDVPIDSIRVVATGFTSDSLQFIDVVPTGISIPFITSGKCDITVLRFTAVGTPAMRVFPNPVSNAATIQFTMQETVPVHLTILSGSGSVVETLLDGTLTLNGGEYNVRANTSGLAAGVYYARISAGVFSEVVPFVVVP